MRVRVGPGARAEAGGLISGRSRRSAPLLHGPAGRGAGAMSILRTHPQRSGGRPAPAGGTEMAQQARIACVIADGFEDSEFRIPYDRLRSQGYEVELIGSKVGQEVRGKRGKERVTIEKEIGQTRADDYVALFIPGGYSPDHLRIDRRFADFARTFDARQKLIAARIGKGRTLTAWPTIQDDLSQLGATVKDEPVVVDRNWITSRKPDDLRAFSDAILERLGHGAQAGQGLGAGQAARP